MGSDLQGHDRVEGHLANALRQQRLAHALLFLGQAGVGRERCATLLARGLLCEALTLPFGCGSCGPCRRVDAGSHPDVHKVLTEATAVSRGLREPEGKRQPSKEIRVDQVRELVRLMRLKPYEGRSRVAIVVDAHLLNANAANALLKTLEEPGDSSYLVLVAPHERAVLPTIASRCQRITFAPLADEVIAALLRQHGADRVDERARLADGSIGHALSLELDAEGDAELPTLKRALLAGTLTERMDAAESLGRDRREVESALVGLQRALAIDLRRAAREPSPRGRDARGRLVSALESIATARAWLAENSNVQLTLEELFLAPASGSRVEPPRRKR
jgi:DNA polymerase-3 subunit delta'